jgi:hypothetical protein
MSWAYSRIPEVSSFLLYIYRHVIGVFMRISMIAQAFWLFKSHVIGVFVLNINTTNDSNFIKIKFLVILISLSPAKSLTQFTFILFTV